MWSMHHLNVIIKQRTFHVSAVQRRLEPHVTPELVLKTLDVILVRLLGIVLRSHGKRPVKGVRAQKPFTARSTRLWRACTSGEWQADSGMMQRHEAGWLKPVGPLFHAWIACLLVHPWQEAATHCCSHLNWLFRLMGFSSTMMPLKIPLPPVTF